jgi:ferredoxin
MKIQSAKLVYFSPTGTTQRVIQSIAQGIKCREIELIDITKPQARQQRLKTQENDLLIVAIPVYMGRLPALLSSWFQSLTAKNTPTACVVMYGNRAYDNALLELKDILKSRGCKPFAGAAYIGEHSFSSDEFPSSVGRPDIKDLLHAESFGNRIYKKLQSVSSNQNITDIIVPGNYPYEGVTDLWKVDFIEVNNSCIQCGKCAEDCPTGAINLNNSKVIDIQKCTLCCACIKKCQYNAKSIKPGLMKEAAARCANFIERKEPEMYI